jgi:hypothetical protein
VFFPLLLSTSDEEDNLSEPPDDDELGDLDDLPPPDDDEDDPDFGPDDDDEDLEALSLPSIGSVDDDLYYFDEIDDDPELDEAYGDYLEDLSDPEDYLPTYDPDDDDDFNFVEDDLPPPDDDDLPPPEEDYSTTSASESISHVPFQNSQRSSKRLVPVDPKLFMLPDNIQLPVILPSQRAEHEAKKLRNSGQFGGSIGSLLAGQAGGKPAAAGSTKDVDELMRSMTLHKTEPAQQSSRSSTGRRGSIIKIDNLKAALDATSSQGGSHVHTPLEDHPVFSKYFKMLKVGVPKELVALKLTQDGFNGNIIQLDPLKPLPQEYAMALEKKLADESLALEEHGGGSPNKVPVSEHPVYGKYFKMLKMGVPRSGVEQKLQADGLDASIIGLDPMTLVPLKERRVSQLTAAVNMTLQQVILQDSQPPADSTLKKKKKKKLFVEGISADQISSESFWAKADEDENEDGEESGAGDGTTLKKKKTSIVLDKDEFEKLFVEENTSSSKIFTGAKVSKTSNDKPITVTASKFTQLISHKRAQNVSIILARIKITNEDMLDSVRRLSAEIFVSSDQLRALMEALPLPEEVPLLQGYQGPLDQLAVPERYMKTMMQLPDAKQRMAILIYKQQFLSRWHEIKHRLGVLESSCDQIRTSKKLQKVLRTILKVVNKLQEDEYVDGHLPSDSATGSGRLHKGITVDSLVQLTTAKAFDRKTTVLQYVVTLIHRHDQEVLSYPLELSYLQEVALKLTPEIVHADLVSLLNELRGHITVLQTLHEEVYEGQDEEVQNTYEDFRDKLLPLIQDLERREHVLRGKYQNILVFFGENAQLLWSDFMGSLWKFTEEFGKSRVLVERAYQQEQKKAQRANNPRGKKVAVRA